MATNSAIACTSSSSSSSSFPQEGPHHPGSQFKFPKRAFWKKTVVHRSFQNAWFSRWPFLDYREDDKTVFCHTCKRMFLEKKNKTSTKADQAFVSLDIIMAIVYLMINASY